ncbi:MAG TPA: FtsX-like permease family protein [Chitinophagales bacterium]|nr:FtsX-like permease family protein [Chitinophagales bacterium]HRK26610.1 FtsX-like permease family protein [Chitinophagales bacterium]
MLFTLAWRNLWRNRSRTLITTASVFFAVVLAIFTMSIQKGVWGNFIRNVVSFYSGYAQVHAHGYWDEQVLDQSFAYSDSLNRVIVAQEGISATAPRIESFALISGDSITKGARIIGIDPQTEDLVTGLRAKLKTGAYLQATDEAVLIAEGLADKLQTNVNDTIVLLGQGYHGSTAAGKYVVKGILKFASPDLNDAFVYMPLTAAQSFFTAPDMLTSLVLLFDNAERMNSITPQLQTTLGQSYEVMTWQEMMPDIKELVRTKEGGTYVIIAILYLLVSFGIFGTLLMMTAERRYEFGMLMAIGMKRAKLAVVVLIESVLVTLLGCLLGVAVSIPLIYYFNVNPITFTGDLAEMYYNFGFEPILPTVFSPTVITEQTIIVTCIALLLAFYPLYHVMNLNEVEAMKK